MCRRAKHITGYFGNVTSGFHTNRIVVTTPQPLTAQQTDTIADEIVADVTDGLLTELHPNANMTKWGANWPMQR